MHRLCIPSVVLLGILAGACSERTQHGQDVLDQHAGILDSPVIDDLLMAAPQTVVDLDRPSPSRWVPDMELAHPQDSLVLPNPFMFAIAQDSLYFGGFQDAIYASGFDGVLMRQIGRAGKGPGEFDQLSDWPITGPILSLGTPPASKCYPKILSISRPCHLKRASCCRVRG